MERRESPTYDFEAKGPDGLEVVMRQIKVQAEKKEYLIHYAHYEQQAVIKADARKEPMAVEYDDALGRPATPAVKRVIAQFTPDFTDIYMKNRGMLVDASFAGVSLPRRHSALFALDLAEPKTPTPSDQALKKKAPP